MDFQNDIQLFDKYTLKENAITKEKYFEEVVTNLTWWQVITLALIEIGTAKVNDILETTQTETDYIVSFHTTASGANTNADIITNDTNFTNTPPVGFTTGDISEQTIYVRVQDRNGDPKCFNDHVSFKVIVYPNPVVSTLSVAIDNYELDRIMVYNALGKHVLTSTTPTFSVEHLPQGFYTIKVSTKQNHFTNQFIKR